MEMSVKACRIAVGYDGVEMANFKYTGYTNEHVELGKKLLPKILDDKYSLTREERMYFLAYYASLHPDNIVEEWWCLYVAMFDPPKEPLKRFSEYEMTKEKWEDMVTFDIPDKYLKK